MRKSPEYAIWAAMIARCTNPNNRAYHYYGGRGIRICDRWRESVLNFLDDMGPRPFKSSLERKDVNGDYEPSNCVWADMDVQSNNRRNNHFLSVGERSMTISQWARELGIPPQRISLRLRQGMSPAKALSLGDLRHA
jgi:hypothetical protein